MENRIIEFNKFGGGLSVDGSIEDVAEVIKRLPYIIKNYTKVPVGIVISALGKMTSLLREGVHLYAANDIVGATKALRKFIEFHVGVSDLLFGKGDHEALFIIKEVWNRIESGLGFLDLSSGKIVEDLTHDQVVPYGEILASKIIGLFLKREGIDNLLLDSTTIFCTDHSFTKANVNKSLTKRNLETKLLPQFTNYNYIIIQGFIGYVNSPYIDEKNNGFRVRTTLGPETSDAVTAYAACMLKASKIVLWKRILGNVPCDISYLECKKLLTGELKGLIHPTTIDEAMINNIPVHIRDYYNPDGPGMFIH